MKILAFSGSPRVDGNTLALVAEAARGAANAGAECEVINICDLNIAPCKACGGCRGTGTCVQKDDMEVLCAKILESDAFIFGTPVYFWGPSAQLKAFIDRWFAIVNGPGREAIRGKKAAVVIAFGATEPDTAQSITVMFREIFRHIGIDCVGTLRVTANKPGDAAANAEAMQEAFALGQALCQ